MVAASIVGSDGTVIVAANGDGEGKPALNLPSVTELDEQASRWLLFTSLPSILTAKVYEAQRRVEINGRPVATISVGVTTALIADRARHLLVVIVATAGLVVAAAMFAVLLVSNQILEQLAILTHGFEQLAAGKSPQEVKVSGVNELGTLAEKFNELSRQVRADRSRLDSDQTHLFDVVRSIQDAVVLLDANRVVLFANKEAQERLAPRNGPLEGASMTSVLGPDHPLLALVESTTTGTEAHDVPLTLPAGGTFLVSFFRLGRERIPAGLLIVIRDLTPVKELETALDSSNRLARLGTLISGLAHQLRSPLNGMNMRLELLRHEAGDAGARHIDKLRKEITRLNEAVEALLRFMRPEQLNLSDFSINEMLKELGARVASDRVSVEYELDPVAAAGSSGPRTDLRSALELDHQRRPGDGRWRSIEAQQPRAGVVGRTRYRRQGSRHQRGATGSDLRLVLHNQSRREWARPALRDAGDRTERREDSDRFAIGPRYGVQSHDSDCIKCTCQICGFQRCVSASIGRPSGRYSAYSRYR